MPQTLAHPIPDRSACVSHAPATPQGLSRIPTAPATPRGPARVPAAPATPQRSARIPASPRTPARTPTNNSNVAPPASAQVPRTPVHARAVAVPTAATPGPFYYIPHPAELEVPTPRTRRGKYYLVTRGEEVGIWGDWYVIFFVSFTTLH
jgi:hypothetical protein